MKSVNPIESGKFYVIMIILFFIGIIIVFICYDIRDKKYKDISKMGQFNGVLKRINRDRGAFVLTKDDRRIVLYGSENFNYKPYALSDFFKSRRFNS